ncbi:hypothetical protein U1Q18_023191 [Sarracenia purpurea var. burkii]
MSCSRALDVWAVAGLKHLLTLIRGQFRDWVMEVVLSQQKSSCEGFVTMTWAIWNARNSNIFRDKIIPFECSYASVKDILTHFHEANPQPQRGKICSKEVQKRRRIPPEYGTYKINVDGVCDTSKRVASLGIVVRNRRASSLQDMLTDFLEGVPQLLLRH